MAVYDKYSGKGTVSYEDEIDVKSELDKLIRRKLEAGELQGYVDVTQFLGGNPFFGDWK